jgi:cytochrome c biogenesis protein CcmG, thiol:disulfide interchange protein DsbE
VRHVSARSWRIPSVLLVASVLLLAAGGCSLFPASVGAKKGNVAADFSLSTLDGDAASLRDYRGRVVILNFFATWCGPCRAEMPDMQAIYGELRDRGLVVVAVNQGEAEESVTAFAREFGLTFPLLLDSDLAIGKMYAVRGYPTTVVIDRKGIVRDVIVGGPLTRTALHRLVDGLLK